MSPVWTEAPKFASALCVYVCVPQCMSIQALRCLGAFPEWIWSAGSQLLSPLMSQCGLKQTGKLHPQQYGGLEGRMRRCFLCLRKKELHLISFGQCLLTFLFSCLVHVWSSVSRSLSCCHRPAVEMHISMCLCRCKTPLLLLRKTFCLAWPAQDLHWSFWGHGWCTRWSIMLGAFPAQGSNLHHQAEIRRVPDLCAPLRAKAIRKMFSRTLEWVSVQ